MSSEDLIESNTDIPVYHILAYQEEAIGSSIRRRYCGTWKKRLASRLPSTSTLSAALPQVVYLHWGARLRFLQSNFKPCSRRKVLVSSEPGTGGGG